MRRIASVVCRVVVAVAIMAARPVGAQAPAEELRKPYSELSARPMWASKVKDGLYVIRGPLGPCLPMPCPAVPTPVNPDGLLHEPGDVAVRVTPEGLILVDTKFAYNIPELLTVIRSISDKPIKYVLASHYHGGCARARPSGCSRPRVDRSHLPATAARSRASRQSK